MKPVKWIAAVLLAAMLVESVAMLSAARADDVSYFEKDGVTYRETRRKVSRPITELRYDEQQRTVYREKLEHGTQHMVRTYPVPVTEYQTQSRLIGRWNPFVRTPYYEQKQVPVTRWEMRTETVPVPVVNRTVAPETSTVRVPVTSTRMVDEETISRVAIGTRPTATAATSAPVGGSFAANSAASLGTVSTPAVGVAAPPVVASSATPSTTLGGITKLDQDPPRVGNNVQWRPATVTR